MAGGGLPSSTSLLAVCAHPDDETFGLGAVLTSFAARGTATHLLCLTHGEASTLGRDDRDLGTVRVAELRAAAGVLGLAPPQILDYPDGGLGDVPLGDLAELVERAAAESGADLLLAFDEEGVSGHPDHARATAAAVEAAGGIGLPVLAWTLPLRIAEALNSKFGTAFGGRRDAEVDLTIAVDRALQLRAAMRHQTQATGNEVLTRRLELLGDREHLRWLVRPRGRDARRDAP